MIQSTLNSLKEKLDQNQEVIIRDQWGEICKVSCSFNNRADLKTIKSFEEESNLILPYDYKNFLLVHNGLDIFEDEYGNGLELYSIEDIHNQKLDYFKEGWYSIGYYRTLQGHLIIDSEKVKENKPYLIYFDSGDPDEYDILNMTFEQWFDEFVKTNGAMFWSK